MSALRNRYNKTTHDAIVSIYKSGGNDSDAVKGLGISLATLYNWQRSHPELKNDIDSAKSDRVKLRAEQALDQLKECEDLAKLYVLRLLRGEVYKTKTRTDGNGAIIFEEKEQVLPSERVLDRFLPRLQNDDDITFTLNIGSTEETDQEIDD